MDGDSPDLSGLTAWARDHRAWLILDDAHGLGVVGPGGRGTPAAQGVSADRVDLYMATFGKALGGFGAFVAGSEALVETLIQYARPYIYTTALPPAAVAAVSAALDILDDEPERQARLHENIRLFRKACSAESLPLGTSVSAIQPIVLGDEQRVMACQHHLKNRGHWVGAIRPPTVPKGTARLRITLSSVHRREDILGLVEALAEFQQQTRTGKTIS
jgi:8-amino-7-oxononanoate synthase